MIIDAPSPSRNTIGAAISSSVAQRPSGICSRVGFSISGRPQWNADISVMTTVGSTELTRMPCGPSSSAETRVMLSSAASERLSFPYPTATPARLREPAGPDALEGS